MKTEVRKELSKIYRSQWINAFFKLKYDKDLTDKQNLDLFFDWAYSVNWKDVKNELEIRGLKK